VSPRDYELDTHPSEARERYTEEHEELWIDFVETAIERADVPDLKQKVGLSKTEFAERLDV
jgi:DNA-binding transcriptional regulator YiaG